MKKNDSKRSGFTLVELIVVVIIIGILAAIAIPRMMEVRKTAKDGADEATARSIISQIHSTSYSYRGDFNKLNTDNKFLQTVQDSLPDVVLELSATPTEGKWGVMYDKAIVYKGVANSDPKILTLKVYKPGYKNPDPLYSAHPTLVIEK